MIKIKLIFLVALLTTSFLHAQKAHVLNLRAGLAFHVFQDHNFSALAYSSNALFYGVDYSRIGSKSIMKIEADLQNANLQSRLDEPLLKEIERTSIMGTVTYLRKKSVPLVDLNWGVSSTTMYDLAGFGLPANNQVSYELTTTLNAAVQISYDFNPKISYKLNADLPMVSVSVRQQEGGFFHMKNLEFDVGRALKSARVYPTNKVFFLHFRHSFEYQYKNRTVGIFYDYLGGYNKIAGKKGSAISKVGISIPLISKNQAS